MIGEGDGVDVGAVGVSGGGAGFAVADGAGVAARSRPVVAAGEGFFTWLAGRGSGRF